MSAPELVTEPELIDARWLEAALASTAPTGPMRDISHEPIGTGLMGRSFRFRLDAGHGPASVVVKLPAAEQSTRQLGAPAYRKEVGFYRDIAPSVTATVPGCFWADISDDGEQFVLVLEDIADAVQGDQLTGCTIDDAHKALENLARLHASTWGDSSLTNRRWNQRETSGGLGEYLPIALGAFEERFGHRLHTDTLPVFGAFVDAVERWEQRQPEARAAVHGDYRLDNLLFDRATGAVTAVDWQTVDLHNPGRDVAYFLGNSLVTADRRAAQDELLQAYHAELVAGGVENYSLEQARLDMQYGSFQGPLVTMLGAFVASRTERSEAMFAAMADRSAAQIIDLDALDRLG